MISQFIIRRLPRYYRYLLQLEELSVESVSSAQFANAMGLTASQIRQDLNTFGAFGRQGYGYNVRILKSKISELLGLAAEKKTILIGVGNLGRAVIMYKDFIHRGFLLCGAFDVSAEIIGSKIGDITVQSIENMEKYLKETPADVAVLCIPSVAAKDVVSALWKCGVTAYWNFSHYDVKNDYPEAIVENVHLNDSLSVLSYEISRN